MLDYLIIGLGLAGVSICEQLDKKVATYKVINDTSQTSSIVAGGLYNPVILKRFTMAWNSKSQLEMAGPFYASLEKKFNVTLDHNLSVMRRFASVEEQNMWFEASDKKELSEFLSPKIINNDNPNIDAPFGYGEVLNTGRIDTALLISTYKEFLIEKDRLVQETFSHDDLRLEDDSVHYKSIRAKRIIFAEGFGLSKNPYFNYLPLTSTKGEYLVIKAPKLQETRAIKSSIFLIPWGNDIYRVGATYKWKDTLNAPTETSKIELMMKLEKFLKCDYEVIDQLAGIRPTVTDRRPLVGQHPKYKNAFVLNGFGSRGVLIAPFASKQLVQSIEENKPIHPEMDIVRFIEKFVAN